MGNSNKKNLNARLEKVLGLKTPAISISFSLKETSDIPPYEAEVPENASDGRTGKVSAGCVFWTKSENLSFSTKPEDHFNCSVGSFTHGLKSLNQVIQNQDVQAILQSHWMEEAEALEIPHLKESPKHISYAPLEKTDWTSDVILLKINALQAMYIHDAGIEGTTFVGKPQCHMIPMAYQEKKVLLSTGCTLSRVRTGMSANQMTCCFPESRLEEFIEKLEKRQSSNADVSLYANKDMKRFKTSSN